MKKQSAGILLYRPAGRGFEVLIVHPGGPFWAKKDAGSWSIPKGEFEDGEAPLAAARREFAEELGMPVPAGECQPLGEALQSSGKVVHAWALNADLSLECFSSNTFEMEWPPKSGAMQEFPENDRAAWVSLDVAKTKLVKGQVPLLETLAAMLGHTLEDAPKEPGQTSLF